MWLSALFRILGLIAMAIGIGCIVWAEHQAPDVILRLLWLIIGVILATFGFLTAVFTPRKSILEWRQLFSSRKP